MEIIFHDYIQIAGIIDAEELKGLINAGVNFLGFPLRLPVNKEDLPEEKAAELIKTINEPNHAVLITYLDKAGGIIQFCKKLGSSIVQLHGNIKAAELKILKEEFPGITVIKSLIIRNSNLNNLKNTIEKLYPFCDAFITDTFDPDTGATGATGKTHDWQISKTLVEFSPKPVILAGGLTPKNVKEAILFVKPAGVDSHTGVEGKNGRKDYRLVSEFVNEAKAAFKMLK